MVSERFDKNTKQEKANRETKNDNRIAVDYAAMLNREEDNPWRTGCRNWR
jgi:hypothetical protein